MGNQQQQPPKAKVIDFRDNTYVTFQPFATATGYVHDDEERLDRLREARRAEQSMLGGDDL